jgi:D-alanyl-D-alanine dipeptidase
MIPTEAQRLNSVDPELGRRIRQLVDLAARYGASVAVVDGYRSQAEQDRLYAQGRTTPGPIVTWTRSSAHTRGQAVDLAFRGPRGITWDVPAWWWDALGYLGQIVGLARPAASKGDLGHFELARR